MKKSQKLLLAGFLVLISWWVYTKLQPKQSDQEYLLGLPAMVADLAEKKQAPEIKRIIAKDYLDTRKRTYQDLNAIISGHVLRGGDITIYTVNPEAEIDFAARPLKAVLKFSAALARGPRQAGALNVIPESASVYHFELNLEKTDDGWLVKSGDWKQPGQ